MIYIVLFIIIALIISFIIFSIIEVYSKILKKESKAFFGMVISFISFFLMMKLRNHLIKNELVENIKIAKLEQENSAFSKEELSNITIVEEKIRAEDTDIYVILLPRKDTIYLNRDFHNKNKFWVHYKKYEVLKLTAPIGYITKN
ncbi:hypothetical protein [Chryseobacterium wanjuense]